MDTESASLRRRNFQLLSTNEQSTAATLNELRRIYSKPTPADLKTKILVIGGTGNVGGEVVNELQKRNADIRLLVRKESDRTPKVLNQHVGQ